MHNLIKIIAILALFLNKGGKFYLIIRKKEFVIPVKNISLFYFINFFLDCLQCQTCDWGKDEEFEVMLTQCENEVKILMRFSFFIHFHFLLKPFTFKANKSH